MQVDTEDRTEFEADTIHFLVKLLLSRGPGSYSSGSSSPVSSSNGGMVATGAGGGTTSARSAREASTLLGLIVAASDPAAASSGVASSSTGGAAAGTGSSAQGGRGLTSQLSSSRGAGGKEAGAAGNGTTTGVAAAGGSMLESDARVQPPQALLPAIVTDHSSGLAMLRTWSGESCVKCCAVLSVVLCWAVSCLRCSSCIMHWHVGANFNHHINLGTCLYPMCCPRHLASPLPACFCCCHQLYLLWGAVHDDPSDFWRQLVGRSAPAFQHISAHVAEGPWKPLKLQIAWILLLLAAKQLANRLSMAKLERTNITPLAQQLENAERYQQEMTTPLASPVKLTPAPSPAAAAAGSSGRDAAAGPSHTSTPPKTPPRSNFASPAVQGSLPDGTAAGATGTSFVAGMSLVHSHMTATGSNPSTGSSEPRLQETGASPPVHSTSSVVFRSTPFKGADISSWGSLASQGGAVLTRPRAQPDSEDAGDEATATSIDESDEFAMLQQEVAFLNSTMPSARANSSGDGAAALQAEIEEADDHQ